MGHLLFVSPLKSCLMLFTSAIILLTISSEILLFKDLCKKNNFTHFSTSLLAIGSLSNRFILIGNDLIIYDLPLSAFQDHYLHLYEGSFLLYRNWLNQSTESLWLLKKNIINNGIVVKFSPNET